MLIDQVYSSSAKEETASPQGKETASFFVYRISQIGPECCLLSMYKIVVYKQPLHVAIKTRTQTSLHDELPPRQVKNPNAVSAPPKEAGFIPGV